MDEPAAATAGGEPQLEHAAQVARPEQREDRHDHRVDDEHGDRRLHEDLQPIALAHADDPGQAAEEDVRRVLQGRPDDRPADDRHDRQDDDRDRRVEQDGQEHPDRRRRQEEREDRAVCGDLHRQRRADDEQADEQQDVVAVPQRRPEPPQPDEEQPDQQHRQQEPAGEAGHISAVVAQTELPDRLDQGRVERLTGPGDDLVLGDADHDRGDGGRLDLPFGLGRLRAERRVGHEQRADQVGREHRLGLAQVAGHPPIEPGPGLGDLVVPQLGPEGGVEDPRRLRTDRRPAQSVERDELGQRGIRQVRDGRLEECLSILAGQLQVERGVDPVDPVIEGELLLGGDGDRLVGREVVLVGHGRPGGLAGGLGLDLALEGQRAGRGDVTRREVALHEVERRLRQDVDAEDRGQRADQDGGRDEQARRVVAREAHEGRGALGQHRPASVLSASRRRGRPGRRGRASGRRGR